MKGRKLAAVLPGSTIGVLGGGQLGRMLALSARRAGYRIHVLSDAAGSPGAQVADHTVVASYDDEAAVAEFAARVDVVTLEFENIASLALAAAAHNAPVRPGVLALHVSQNRQREKEFLRANGFRHAPFVTLEGPVDLRAVALPAFPFVAKSAGFGYDGKGQVVARGPEDFALVAALLETGPVVVEEFIELAAELSVVGARSLAGDVALYQPALNRHVGGILDTTIFSGTQSESPMAGLAWARLVAEAHAATAELLELLEVVGVACVEFFVTTAGELLVNEVAPRPHNSGHLTIEACHTSQFEQQWRAVCGLPLGSTQALTSAAMTNLLGDAWVGGEPRWDRALARQGAHLHLYGKQGPRPGRKMGHITAVAQTAAAAERIAVAARADLDASDAV
jgi:5-(carboxyamino)imidazole ribonucleotide synthase